MPPESVFVGQRRYLHGHLKIPSFFYGIFCRVSTIFAMCSSLNLIFVFARGYPHTKNYIESQGQFYDSLQRFKVPIPDILAPSTAFPNINGLSITYAI